MSFQKSLNFISKNGIIVDLDHAIRTGPTKYEKRKNRMEAVLRIEGRNPEDASKIPHPEPVLSETKMEKIYEFLSRPISEKKKDIIAMPDSSDSDPVKKAIDDALTSALNANGKVYKAACGYAARLEQKIRNHKVFGPLYERKMIIFYLKGGVAMRLRLLREVKDEEIRKLVEKNFNLGGDNDTCILVNPRMKNCEEIRRSLVDFVFASLRKMKYGFNVGVVKSEAARINKVTVGELDLDVEQGKRKDFIMEEVNAVPMLVSSGEEHQMYVSCNKTLDFTHGDERCKFDLVRVKACFTIADHLFAAEVLDVAIPYCFTIKNFSKFSRGKWISQMELPERM
jgi:hypothetical protein